MKKEEKKSRGTARSLLLLLVRRWLANQPPPFTTSHPTQSYPARTTETLTLNGIAGKIWRLKQDARSHLSYLDDRLYGVHLSTFRQRSIISAVVAPLPPIILPRGVCDSAGWVCVDSKLL